MDSAKDGAKYGTNGTKDSAKDGTKDGTKDDAKGGTNDRGWCQGWQLSAATRSAMTMRTVGTTLVKVCEPYGFPAASHVFSFSLWKVGRCKYYLFPVNILHFRVSAGAAEGYGNL